MSWSTRVRRGVVAVGVAAGVSVGVLAPAAGAAPTPFTFRIVPVHSGLSLTVASLHSGAEVTQQTTVGTSGSIGQRWRFNYIPGSSIAQIMSEGVPGTCLQPGSAQAGGGTVIVVRTCVNPSDTSTPQFWRQHDTVFAGQVVSRWENALMPGQYLAIENARTDPGARLVQFPAVGGPNHMFDNI